MSRPDIADLRAAIRYCPTTGLCWWKYREDLPKSWNTRWAHQPAFTADNGNGYRQGEFQSKKLLAHRVAFAISFGYWPKEVDHVNGERGDNRLANLRASDHATNMRNQRRRVTNTSGFTGVSWERQKRKWAAKIMVGGKHIHLGTFDRLEDAAAARKAAEVEHQFDPYHGRSDRVRAERDLEAA